MDAHALHSPFYYDLYTQAITSTRARPVASIEEVRRSLLKDYRLIPVTDLGAGPAGRKLTERRIGDIARTSMSPLKFNLLYQQIIQYLNAQVIVELGTSLGINALYMAASHPGTRLTTFEGAPAIAQVAAMNFERFPYSIDLVEGPIEERLPAHLENVTQVDVALIDAHHKFTPTLHFFNLLKQKISSTGAIIIDDIHYNREMEHAWQTIRDYPEVTGSIDLFRCGIVIFRTGLTKQHLILRI